MTRDDIIRMAREAGGYRSAKYPDEWRMDDDDLERFAELVRADAIADEREACAKLCENMPLEWEDQPSIAQAELATMMDCALAIRARGQA